MSRWDGQQWYDITEKKKNVYFAFEPNNILVINIMLATKTKIWCAIIQLYPRGITVTIQDRLNNKEVIIRPIAPYKMYCSLGTEQGTSKNQKAQHGKLVKTSATHNRKLACSAMSPKCAWVHYSAVFQSSVGCPLSMCHLSQHQLHDLQKKYIPTLLNKIGVARTHALKYWSLVLDHMVV